jgi:hypothetical protein
MGVKHLKYVLGSSIGIALLSLMDWIYSVLVKYLRLSFYPFFCNPTLISGISVPNIQLIGAAFQLKYNIHCRKSKTVLLKLNGILGLSLAEMY